MGALHNETEMKRFIYIGNVWLRQVNKESETGYEDKIVNEVN